MIKQKTIFVNVNIEDFINELKLQKDSKWDFQITLNKKKSGVNLVIKDYIFPNQKKIISHVFTLDHAEEQILQIFHKLYDLNLNIEDLKIEDHNYFYSNPESII